MLTHDVNVHHQVTLIIFNESAARGLASLMSHNGTWIYETVQVSHALLEFRPHLICLMNHTNYLKRIMSFVIYW